MDILTVIRNCDPIDDNGNANDIFTAKARWTLRIEKIKGHQTDLRRLLIGMSRITSSLGEVSIEPVSLAVELIIN